MSFQELALKFPKLAIEELSKNFLQYYKKLILLVTAADVRLAFLRVNLRKATGPDGVPGCEFRSCADQLVGVFTDIFNLSLLRSEVPICFEMTTIVMVPKKSQATYLNDYLPMALTSIIMKCFE
eukprot:g36126.t1